MSQRIDRFKNSHRLVWFTLIASVGLQVLAAFMFGSEAVPILTASIPSMLALVGGWTMVTNWAEVRGENAGFAQRPPDQSRQTVNVAASVPNAPNPPNPPNPPNSPE